MNKTLILLIILGLLAACEDEKTSGDARHYAEDTTQTDEIVDDGLMPSDTIFYSIQGFNKTIDGCVNDTANCATFNSGFPLVEMRLHGNVSDSINYFIRKKLYNPLIGEKQANGINDLVEPYFAAYKIALLESQQRGEAYAAPWWYQRYFTVYENTPRIFSLEHTEKSFAGGPHPNHFINYYHFNPKTGKRLGMGDIFEPAGLKTLTKIGEKKFRKKMKLAASADLEDQGYWFKDKVFALPQNFILQEKGVTFYFNPYEVAANAMGKIELFFTYSELAGIIKDEFNPEAKDKPAA